MAIQNNRELRTLKMEKPLFKAIEKKRKKEKTFATFHELGIYLMNLYVKEK